MIQPGSTVRFVKLPAWVAWLPDESRRVFEFSLGRTYRVQEIDGQGLFVLDVSADIDQRFGGFMNDLRLEAEFLEEVDIDPRIIGFWKGVGGDYGLINEYRPDGMLVQHVGDCESRPSPFRIEGDYVITSLEQPDGSISEDRKQYAISGDTLTLFFSPTRKMYFQRITNT